MRDNEIKQQPVGPRPLCPFKSNECEADCVFYEEQITGCMLRYVADLAATVLQGDIAEEPVDQTELDPGQQLAADILAKQVPDSD